VKHGPVRSTGLAGLILKEQTDESGTKGLDCQNTFQLQGKLQKGHIRQEQSGRG